MKKLVVLFCLVVMSLLVKAQTVYTVCYDNVKIHTTADLNGPTSGDLKKNEKVNVLGSSGEWALIDNNGSVAYVLKYFLKKDEVEAPKEPEQPAVAVVVDDQVKQKSDSLEKKTDDVAIEEHQEIPEEKQSKSEENPNDVYYYSAIAVDYSFQNITTGVKSNTEKQLLNGFNFGYLFHRPLANHVVMLFGLHYQFTIKHKSESGVSRDFMNHNLKVPIKFGFSTKIAKSSCFSIYAGPCLDFNVATQNRVTYSHYDVTTDVVNGKVKGEVNGNKVSKSDDDYKSLNFFDIPLGVGVAFKFSMFGIRFEYEWGLVNRYIKEYRDAGAKWRSDQLTAGFLIII